jgi:hypothetical protein
MIETGKKKSWFRRHWILTIFFVIFIIGGIGAIFFPDEQSNNSETEGLTENLSSASINSNAVETSSKYVASDIEKMSLSKKLDLCTKDIAGDLIDIPQVKNEAYMSCYQIYYSGGEEVLNEYIQGIK